MLGIVYLVEEGGMVEQTGRFPVWSLPVLLPG